MLFAPPQTASVYGLLETARAFLFRIFALRFGVAFGGFGAELLSRRRWRWRRVQFDRLVLASSLNKIDPLCTGLGVLKQVGGP